MNALGVLILIVSLCMVLFASRRWASIGVMIGVLYLTQGQQINVFGINMFGIRFVELAAFLRVIFKGEFKLKDICAIDKALVLVTLYSTVIFVLRSDTEQKTFIGSAVDFILCYFAFRGLAGGVDDLRWFLKRFILLLAPYAAMVVFETLSGNNLFSSMGGVVYGGEGWMRGGRLRSQGSFRQASLLGTLGACFFPLYIGLWLSKFDRKQAAVGIVLCLAIVWASNSGGPANGTAVGIVGWSLWKFRSKMQFFRRCAALGFVALTLAMKAPVWYLLARISSISGGDGWHRAHLLDMATQNIDKWWFWGMRIEDTRDWFPYVLSITGGADITNQYVGYGINAGLVAVVLFFAFIIRTYQKIGQALDVVQTGASASAPTAFLLWGVGVMFTVHCVNFLNIGYFDQTYVIWYFQLALIANLTESVLLPASSPPTFGEATLVNDDNPEKNSPNTRDPRLA